MRRSSGEGMPTWVQQFQRAFWCSLRLGHLLVVLESGSTSCFSMVSTGFRKVMGSWKIIDMLLPRMLSHELFIGSGHFRSNCTGLISVRRIAWNRPRHGAVFSSGDPSPNTSTGSCPSRIRRRCPRSLPVPATKLMPRTAWTLPCSVAKLDGEIFDFQQTYPITLLLLLLWGQSASLTPSPMKFSAQHGQSRSPGPAR